MDRDVSRIRRVRTWHQNRYAEQHMYRTFMSLPVFPRFTIFILFPCVLFWGLYDLGDLLPVNPFRVWIVRVVAGTDAPLFHGTFAASMAMLVAFNYTFFPYFGMIDPNSHRIFVYEGQFRRFIRPPMWVHFLELSTLSFALHATFSLMRGQWWLYRAVSAKRALIPDEPGQRLMLLGIRCKHAVIFWSVVSVTVAYTIVARQLIYKLLKLDRESGVPYLVILTCIILPAMYV